MRKSAACLWSVKDKENLDAVTAHEHFNGLTAVEAENLFKLRGSYYEEDLWSMPQEAFEFYLPAFIAYLQSSNSSSDADSASAFIQLIKYFLEHQPSHLKENSTLIKNALLHISQNQKKYEATPDIYGNFHNAIGKIIKHLNA
jgi:hypothetical protein